MDDPRVVVLEKLRVGANRVIGRGVLEDMPGMHVEAFIEDTYEGLLVELRGHVLAERLAERIVDVTWDTCRMYPFPATWWQHLKQSLPRCIRRRLRPVREAYHEIGFQGTQQYTVEQFAVMPACSLPPAYSGRYITRYERVRQP